MSNIIEAMGQRAHAAARTLATLSTDHKNAALRAIAAGLRAQQDTILAANALDIAAPKPMASAHRPYSGLC